MLLFPGGPRAVSYPHDPIAPGLRIVRADGDDRLSDASYAEVVAKMPIPCVDAIFILKEDCGKLQRVLYLAHRSVYPQRDVWHFGGRVMFNDETLEGAISRAVERETKVKIDPTRFVFILQAYYSWAKTAQGDFFGKNVATTYACVITPDELKRIREGIIKSEYYPDFGVQPFTRKRLVEEERHSVLVDMYDTLFPPLAQRKKAAQAILDNTWWQRSCR